MSLASARLFAIATLSLLAALSLHGDTGSPKDDCTQSKSSPTSPLVKVDRSDGLTESFWNKQPRLNLAVAPYLPDSFRGANSEKQVGLQLNFSKEGKVLQALPIKNRTQG